MDSIDRIIKWIFLLIMLPMLLGPIFLMAAPMAMIGGALWGNADERMIERVLEQEGIRAGGEVSDLAETMARLRDLSALPGEAAQKNDFLHVAMIERNEATLAPAEGDLEKSRTISVDVAEAGFAGALLITADPVVWQVERGEAAPRAKLAFESSTWFDVRNANQGLIAGFRSRVFGAHESVSVHDLLSDRIERNTRFCNALSAWARHFGVEPGSVKVTHLVNPKRITVLQTGIVSDGGHVLDSRWADVICEGVKPS